VECSYHNDGGVEDADLMRCGQSCQATSDRSQHGIFVGFEDGGDREVAERPIISSYDVQYHEMRCSAAGMNLSSKDYVDGVSSDSQVALHQVPEFHRLQEDVRILRARFLRICGGIPGEPAEGSQYGRSYVDTRLAAAGS
jgi:hypothetical protein